MDVGHATAGSSPWLVQRLKFKVPSRNYCTTRTRTEKLELRT
jgi:hypothetical protein